MDEQIYSEKKRSDPSSCDTFCVECNFWVKDCRHIREKKLAQYKALAEYYARLAAGTEESLREMMERLDERTSS